MYVLRAACLAIKYVISPSAKKRVAENVQIKWLLGNDYAYVYTNNPNAYIKLKCTEKTKNKQTKGITVVLEALLFARPPLQIRICS